MRVAAAGIPAGQIATIVGTGTCGFAGDGGSATSAQVNHPSGIVLDTAGNQYIADTSNHRIRKVTAATGTITTVAGGASAGFDGDGGLATSALLSSPTGVTIDTSGNLYIADRGNHRIRKVSPSGVISTVAGTGTVGFGGDGGLAVNAKLSSPTGVAVDAAGGVLYIADSDKVRVRRLAIGTGVITTIAGSGSLGGSDGDGGQATTAQLSVPTAVAVDASGNLYIADNGNNRIRMVTTAGVISTVVGPGTIGGGFGEGAPAVSASLNGPFSVFVDAVTANLYVADTRHSRVRKVTAATGTITTVAGSVTAGFAGDGGIATAAELAAPSAAALDTANNLYIVDTDNCRIRKITAGAVIVPSIRTIAGTGAAAFSGDGATATAAALNLPSGIAVDGNGNQYIADTSNHRVRKISSGSGTVTTIAGSGSSAGGGFSGDGGAAVSATLSFPRSVALDSAGNVYIADSGNNRVRKVTTATGLITTIAGSGSPGGFTGDGGAATIALLNAPVGVAVDGAGILYIADRDNNRIRKVTVSGVITTVAGGTVGGSSGDGGLATSALLSGPTAVAIDATGNLFIADRSNARIRKVTAAGIIATVAGTGTGFGEGGPATAAQLNSPSGITIDSAGNLYVADSGNERVRKVTAATGVITTVAGSGSRGFGGDTGVPQAAQLATPSAVAVDGAGDLYVADSDNSRIRKISLFTCGAVTLAPATLPAATLGAAYSQTITQTGATGATFAITSGTLPAGLGLSASGVISGTPTSTGTSAFTVTATDANTCTGSLAYAITVSTAPQVTLDKTALLFAATSNGAALVAQTSAQSVRLVQKTAGAVSWTATANVPWLVVSPSSGTGSSTLNISVRFAAGLAASQTGSVTLSLTGAANTVGPIIVTLKTISAGASAAPFGSFDTPVENTVLSGSVAITGWALDDLEVKEVQVWREPHPNDPAAARFGGTDGRNGKVFVGFASFVSGARPDVESVSPAIPLNSRAGWGYLMLTRGFVWDGQGPFKFYAYALDVEGNVALLGTKSLSVNNAGATKPFGALDSPQPGKTASGMFPNTGWVVTPNPSATIAAANLRVSIDGTFLTGVPSLSDRPDITGAFPTFGTTGAGRGLFIDTRAFPDGIHTIGWLATDSLGNAEGIGSEFFGITNEGATLTAGESGAVAVGTPARATGEAIDTALLNGATSEPATMLATHGWNAHPRFERLGPNTDGVSVLRGEELDRFELHFGDAEAGGWTGAVRVGDELRGLPIGSRLDPWSGVFTWQPGPGFLGAYDLVFAHVGGDGFAVRRDVRVTIAPKGSSAVAHVSIDTPSVGDDVRQSFRVAGWAFDPSSAQGTGIDAVQVWAYPQAGIAPAFLGAATLDGVRPDVADLYGEGFRRSGFGLTANPLSPGVYTLAVFAHSSVTGTYLPAKCVQITVR